MARNPRRLDAQLEELYAQIPDVECDGSCHGACCFISCSGRERERMERASGKKLETIDRMERTPGTRFGPDNRPLARFTCSMLTDGGRCSVYDLRPLVCRLYGAAESMPCRRGCKPAVLITDDQAKAMVERSMEIGGLSNSTAVAKEIMEYAERDPTLIDEFRRLYAPKENADAA